MLGLLKTGHLPQGLDHPAGSSDWQIDRAPRTAANPHGLSELQEAGAAKQVPATFVPKKVGASGDMDGVIEPVGEQKETIPSRP